jgi:hypothetical protein
MIIQCCTSSKIRATGGTRTPDQLITNQLLYQLSYSGLYLFTLVKLFGKNCQTTMLLKFDFHPPFKSECKGNTTANNPQNFFRKKSKKNLRPVFIPFNSL